MSVSKRLRYEVFRRDNFTCRSCGAKAPEARLEPDHVVPVALGGSDDPSNLATACSNCNSGKSSSSPDAPLVAEVSEDALRWSHAMADAAVQMRAELAGRVEIHMKFDSWWNAWTYGNAKKVPLPRPDDWRSSVDSFLGAGLPLDILGWCVDKAMRSKASPDQTWRYMCGIAWGKAKELQVAAQALAAGTSTNEDDEEISPEIMAGRADLACEMLGDCEPEELDRLRTEAREGWSAGTKDAEHIAAVQISWSQTRIALSWLAYSLCDLLPLLPDDIIREATREARVKLYDEYGPGFTRAEFAARAVDIAAERYESPLACARETAPF